MTLSPRFHLSASEDTNRDSRAFNIQHRLREKNILDFSFSIDLSPSQIQPVILAGDPAGSPPDSPNLRIDPNVPDSTYAGVGSVNNVSTG